MREDISERINELLEEPLQTPTKQEAYDILKSCGIITEEGTIAPAYEDILQFRRWHNGEYDYQGEGVVNPAVITIKD